MNPHDREQVEARMRELDVKVADTEQRAAALDIWIHLRCSALPTSHLTDALAAARAQIRALQAQREVLFRRMGT